MKKSYESASYEITKFKIEFVLTVSSDRENAYVDSDTIWKDWGDEGWDD